MKDKHKGFISPRALNGALRDVSDSHPNLYVQSRDAMYEALVLYVKREDAIEAYSEKMLKTQRQIESASERWNQPIDYILKRWDLLGPSVTSNSEDVNARHIRYARPPGRIKHISLAKRIA